MILAVPFFFSSFSPGTWKEMLSLPPVIGWFTYGGRGKRGQMFSFFSFFSPSISEPPPPPLSPTPFRTAVVSDFSLPGRTTPNPTYACIFSPPPFPPPPSTLTLSKRLTRFFPQRSAREDTKCPALPPPSPFSSSRSKFILESPPVPPRRGKCCILSLFSFPSFFFPPLS